MFQHPTWLGLLEDIGIQSGQKDPSHAGCLIHRTEHAPKMSVRKGVFRDLTGLAYKSGPDLTGFIDEDGGYEYNAQGPDIQWFIGDLFLGQTLPQARTSIIDLLLKSKGDIQKAHVLTKARLLCSLSPEIDMRSGIHVSTKARTRRLFSIPKS